MAFAWEPVGHKFAFIHGESPRINVSVYRVQKGGSLELLSKFSRLFVVSKLMSVVVYDSPPERRNGTLVNQFKRTNEWILHVIVL